MCLHVAAFVIPFNLIDIQYDHVLKKLNFDRGGGWYGCAAQSFFKPTPIIYLFLFIYLIEQNV